MLGAVVVDVRWNGGAECPFEAVMTMTMTPPQALQSHCEQHEQQPEDSREQKYLVLDIWAPGTLITAHAVGLLALSA